MTVCFSTLFKEKDLLFLKMSILYYHLIIFRKIHQSSYTVGDLCIEFHVKMLKFNRIPGIPMSNLTVSICVLV